MQPTFCFSLHSEYIAVKMDTSECYLLVEFTDNCEIEVIPSNWLDGTKCAVWPPYKSTNKLARAVRCKEKAEDHWESYPIRVLYSNGKLLLCPQHIGFTLAQNLL